MELFDRIYSPICKPVLGFFRPLAPASVVPAVTAFLNRLLCETESESLGKGLSLS